MLTTLRFDCRFRYPEGFKIDARFEVAARIVALVGPSGCGKTTIVSLIAGLLSPDNGNIQIGDSTLVNTLKGVHTPPERRRIGVVFQDHSLFPHMSVRANIEYGARRRPASGVDIKHIIKTLGVEDVAHRLPHQLSGGQQQRVALARALASNPKLLLLDEPLTAVEEDLREQIAELIERVIEEFQVPALLVSHNRKLIDRLADQLVFIQEGSVVSIQQGSRNNQRSVEH